MTIYSVTLVRTPGLDDAERANRLRLAYDLILSFGNDTAERESLDSDALGGGTPDPKRDGSATGVYHEVETETADLGELGSQTQAGDGNPAPMGQSARRSITDER
jgi:hypothetical protein